jgi:hypothetical protein
LAYDRPLGWPWGLLLAATKVSYRKPFYQNRSISI